MRRRSPIALAERFESRLAWYSRRTAGRARVALRDALTAAGVPLRPERLVLDCAHGEEASGLFSEVAAVVGCLAHYEARPELYSGLLVDFQDHGLYYDAGAGPNWWEYYFERVEIPSARDARRRVVPTWQHDDFAETVEGDMPRHVAAGIVARHVRIKESVRSQADRYWLEQAGGAHVIGVHYRGTDKWEGAPPVPYEAMEAAVRASAPAAGSAPWKVFVATDEQAFLDYMVSAHPGRVLFRPMRRSVDGSPIHKSHGDGFRKGEDAVLDCLLLARCEQLIRTDSDLSLFSTFFSPTLPVTLLSTPS
jgi:hypothetical protein